MSDREQAGAGRERLGMTGYQWLVLLAAWMGWGFDVFDGLLFNYVSRLCVPDLLHLAADAPDRGAKITFWTGALTSLLLVGWGVGGILFGYFADRFGRRRTLLVTMLVYSFATAGCAFAQSIWMLAAFRAIASLGIGGEWAAGAALVAETVPERRRVAAGVILYTASPVGVLLATFVADLFTNRIDVIATNQHFEAWRVVFLTGLLPAVAAAIVRRKIREPDVWRARAARPRIGELFSPLLVRRTIGGLSMAALSIIAWWGTNAFIPRIAGFMAREAGENVARFSAWGGYVFNAGGLVGSLIVIPLAGVMGRRGMFLTYFALSAAAILGAFALPMSPWVRLAMFFPAGAGVFGVFGVYPFYLPELFPTRLRGIGSGFCYNTGRFIAAPGPFIVASIAAASTGEADLRRAVAWMAAFPAIGIVLLLFGMVEETRGRGLAEDA